MNPLNSEMPEFYWILVSLKPAFTNKNNGKFIQFVKEGETQQLKLFTL